MPPKRTADTQGGSSKRSKTNSTAQPQEEIQADAPAPAPNPASKRWSAVSVSRNFAQSFAEHANYHTYKTLCQARVDGKSANDDDNDNDNDKSDAKCDLGEMCMCNKPAADYPEHPFTISEAGHNKFIDQIAHTNVREPDAFDMYVFNDFAGYGVWEVLQNLVLDFVEAKDNWKEQWAVCQALPFDWMTGAAMPFTMLDADSVTSTFHLLGQMFLAMLATFESKDLLKPDSEVKNLGMVMAQYLLLADELREYTSLDSGDDKGPDFSRFDHYILANAKKHSIKLQGPSKTDKFVRAIEDDEDDNIELPRRPADPWKLAKAHKALAQEYGAISTVQKNGMGGDSFDITSWTSARRKQHSFNKEDPLGKKEMDAIKQGMVMQMG
ncbi:hypothetical protein BDW74DRAFT_153060 [Aspergillus multicolor]|uniref:uncharacterized protein n=1 Tax=Aspergillus multicolor TaxID=41759 RepID=UPI003CCD7CA1